MDNTEHHIKTVSRNNNTRPHRNSSGVEVDGYAPI